MNHNMSLVFHLHGFLLLYPWSNESLKVNCGPELLVLLFLFQTLH